MCPPPLATNDPVLEEQLDDRFLCHQFVLEIGLLLSAEKGDIKFSRWRSSTSIVEWSLETLISMLSSSSRRRAVARGSQSTSCPVWKPMAKVGLVGGAVRRAASAAASA